jgi:hypothetical protein
MMIFSFHSISVSLNVVLYVYFYLYDVCMSVCMYVCLGLAAIAAAADSLDNDDRNKSEQSARSGRRLPRATGPRDRDRERRADDSSRSDESQSNRPMPDHSTLFERSQHTTRDSSPSLRRIDNSRVSMKEQTPSSPAPDSDTFTSPEVYRAIDISIYTCLISLLTVCVHRQDCSLDLIPCHQMKNLLLRVTAKKADV